MPATSFIPPAFTVEGLAFEVHNLLTLDASCVGFNRLVLEGCIAFDGMAEFIEACDRFKWFKPLCAALDAQAQDAAFRWHLEELPSLRQWLARR